MAQECAQGGAREIQRAEETLPPVETGRAGGPGHGCREETLQSETEHGKSQGDLGPGGCGIGADRVSSGEGALREKAADFQNPHHRCPVVKSHNHPLAGHPIDSFSARSHDACDVRLPPPSPLRLFGRSSRTTPDAPAAAGIPSRVPPQDFRRDPGSHASGDRIVPLSQFPPEAIQIADAP